MRILILGGTKFLSRELVVQALDAGDDVTVAARGVSGPVPDGVRHIPVDRSVPGTLGELAGTTYDAVVDIGRRPSWVREAVTTLGDSAGHWTFVSSVSVYADEATPGQQADAALREPAAEGVDETDAAIYGELKVGSEQIVAAALGDRAFICRPGLIVGPDDPSGRFSYWPARIARGGEIAAPGSPDDAVQLIDVRDCAAWILAAARSGLVGALDAVSPPLPRGDLLAAIGRGVGVTPELSWVPDEFLVEQGVESWMGPGSLPLWVPLPEYAGFMAHDVSASLSAGLRLRPLEETARDTLAWLERTPDADVSGLTADKETALLAAWRARSTTSA